MRSRGGGKDAPASNMNCVYVGYCVASLTIAHVNTGLQRHCSDHMMRLLADAISTYFGVEIRSDMVIIAVQFGLRCGYNGRSRMSESHV